jgi:hypothetical protein
LKINGVEYVDFVDARGISPNQEGVYQLFGTDGKVTYYAEIQPCTVELKDHLDEINKLRRWQIEIETLHLMLRQRKL